MNTLFFRLMRIYENQWYQYSRGHFDEQLFDAYQKHMLITLSESTLRARWDFYKVQGFFHPDFVVYVDTYVDESPPVVFWCPGADDQPASVQTRNRNGSNPSGNEIHRNIMHRIWTQVRAIKRAPGVVLVKNCGREKRGRK